MTDRDNITLPRKHIDYAAHALEHFNKDAPDPLVSEIIHHLRTALAAEPTKQESVESDDDEEFTREDVVTLLLEVMDWTYAQAHRNRPMTEAEQKVLDDIRTALAAEPTKQEPGLAELARQMKPLDADMAAILHDNLDSLYIEDEPALAAEPTKPEPVAWLSRDEARLALWKAINSREFGNPTDDKLILDHLRQQGLWIGKVTSPALAAETPKHPGYIIGSHWLETAYSRICAGEAEADVLRDCGWERVDDIEALRQILFARRIEAALRRDEP